jgi:hypothetical protein
MKPIAKKEDTLQVRRSVSHSAPNRKISRQTDPAPNASRKVGKVNEKAQGQDETGKGKLSHKSTTSQFENDVENIMHQQREQARLDKVADKIFVPSMFNLDHQISEAQLLQRRRNCCSKRCRLCFLVGCLLVVIVVVTVTSIAMVAMKDQIFGEPSFRPGNASSGCKPCPVECQCGIYAP